MKILIVSQYFWPERFLINDLAKELSKQGHQITVLTGKPNYPEGLIYDGYLAKHAMCEIFDEDIAVYRAPLRPRKKSNFKIYPSIGRIFFQSI